MTVEQRYVAHGLVMAANLVLLLQRGEGRYLGEYWDIPGGTVETGESPAEAAVRECLEETGLRCRLGSQLTHFQNMDTGGRDINFHTITFRLYAGPDPQVTISSEHRDYRWVTMSQAAQMPLVWHVARTLGATSGSM